jgi:manganese/zinc/iron transport system substrate-binding protein
VRAEYKFNVRLVAGDDALYSDALGDAGSGADSYLGMIRHNARVIARALGQE